MKIQLDFQKNGQAEGDLYLAGETANPASEASQGKKIAIVSHP